MGYTSYVSRFVEFRLYIVGAFIGETGYKNGTQQLINANRQNSISPNATPESGSAEVPISIVSENEEESNNTNEKKSIKDKPDVPAKDKHSSSIQTQEDAMYLSLAEKYRDGTATVEETEQLQKIVDEAAQEAGYIPAARYHQTSVRFNTFKTYNPVAAKYDSETPNGIFFKMNDHDIGIGGDVQMKVYLETEKTL